MKGPNQTATVYNRSSGGWPSTGTEWICYIDPMSTLMTILGETSLASLHRAIGNVSVTIRKGAKITVGTRTFLVQLVAAYSRPGFGSHHQEVWMKEIELP